MIMERIEISHKTIIFTAVFLISLWFLYQIRSIILLLFIVVIFTAALTDLVDKIEKIGIPRTLAILIIYLVVIASLVGAIFLIFPPMIEQTGAFFKSLPKLFKETGLAEFIKPDLIVSELSSLPGAVFKFILGAFSNLLSVFVVLVLTFYSLYEIKRLPQYLQALFADKEKEEKILSVINKIQENIGSWVRGELILMIIVGVASYIGFKILGLEFALALAVIAGFLELIPNIGPTIAAIPAIIVGLSMSWPLGLGALLVSIIVQQLENHIIVPQIMKHVIGINPIVTILTLIIGYKLGGAGGAILSIPLLLTAKIILVELYLSKKDGTP